ncbi:MAG: GTP pyrophosphokinase [Coriobacteriia bacterium]|nr:GTP pyrophosphokinase [Coriobacteriia bacterium]
MLYTPTTIAAMKFAFKAHEGQLDRSGIPYVSHPLHLAEQMDTEDETVVALLHDIIEDTEYTADDLRALGISDAALEAILLLTHDDDVPYLDYVRNLKDNPLAVKVKLADLHHNSQLSRLAKVRDRDLERLEKYTAARAILGDTSPALP